MLFHYGETPLLKTSVSPRPYNYMFSSLCVVSLWRNSTFSMHMLTRKDQWDSPNHRENQATTRKPRFQDQWVTKTIEKTEQYIHIYIYIYIYINKISGPMGSQSHRENKQQQNTNKMSGSMIRVHNHWSWNHVLFICVLVFSMVLATHWSWNLGFLVLLLWFSWWFWLSHMIFQSSAFFALPSRMSNGMLPGCLTGCQDGNPLL